MLEVAIMKSLLFSRNETLCYTIRKYELLRSRVSVPPLQLIHVYVPALWLAGMSDAAP